MSTSPYDPLIDDTGAWLARQKVTPRPRPRTWQRILYYLGGELLAVAMAILLLRVLFGGGR